MKKDIKHNAYAINKLIDIIYEDIYFKGSFSKCMQEKIECHFDNWQREIMPKFKILDIFDKKQFIKLIEKLHRKNYNDGLNGKGNYVRQTEQILIKWEVSVMGNNNMQNKLWVSEYETKFSINQGSN